MASKLNLDVSEKLDITCKKGDTFNLGLLLKDSAGTALTLSASGYEFLMQVRGRRSGAGRSRSLIIGTASKGKSAVTSEGANNFTVTIDDSGNATFSASDTIMARIAPGRYVYDIQQIVGGVSTTILEGRFIVNDDISNLEV
tara:strand:- start:1334 stop:1759 length:426 start_codon:yes stop_codon:yes gene_type:complete